MRATMPELLVLAAILLGIVGGGAAYYFWRDLWVCVGAASASLASAAALFNWASSP